MKIRLLLAAVAVLAAAGASAQSNREYIPKWAVKTNLLYDATTTVNLGIEARLGRRTTLDFPVNYNPWTFGDNKKIKHVLVQPEFRWWFCEAFNGHFLGLHAHYAYYNAGGVGPLTRVRDNRYEGWLAGAGVSYGYHWVWTNRWSMEFTAGAGYAYLDYEKYGQTKCAPFKRDENKHYFGLTKAGITLIFMIK